MQPLVGSKLMLRLLEESDITEDYLRWLNDPEVTRYLGVGKEPATRESVRQYVQRFKNSDSNQLFAIIDLETGKHIGNVTLNHIHRVNGTTDTGIMIGDKTFWGKGYAFEAWVLLIDYAFSTLGLRKIIAGAVAGNGASIAVLKRLGFREEGVLREEFFLDGKYLDTIRLGLLRHEFRKPAGNVPAGSWTHA